MRMGKESNELEGEGGVSMGKLSRLVRHESVGKLSLWDTGSSNQLLSGLGFLFFELLTSRLRFATRSYLNQPYICNIPWV